MDQSFWYSGEGTDYKINTSTLKSVCGGEKWIKIEFKIEYLIDALSLYSEEEIRKYYLLGVNCRKSLDIFGNWISYTYL